MTAFFRGSNRRFVMSAKKPVGIAVILLGALGSSVHADPITWPSGLDTWLIFLAGQNGGASPGYVGTYQVPSAAAVAPQASTVAPQAAPAQPAPAPSAVSTPAVVSAPQPQPAPAPAATTTPAVIATSSQSSILPAVVTPAAAASAVTAPSSGPVDAFINLGNGPYPLAYSITTGNALPWYDSTKIASLFGGQPTAQQIQSFDSAVLQTVQQTFSSSGISVSLTTNPNVPALHTLSLVSNTAAASMSNAIGMTQLGASGFSFIDQIAPSAQNLNQLEMIVAHNISHELMLAFGVGENYDQTGNYIDAKMANWSMMVSANATFSPAAAQAIEQALGSQNTTGGLSTSFDAQVLNPVPEPTTVALWAAAAAVLVWYQRARALRAVAANGAVS